MESGRRFYSIVRRNVLTFGKPDWSEASAMLGTHGLLDGREAHFVDFMCGGRECMRFLVEACGERLVPLQGTGGYTILHCEHPAETVHFLLARCTEKSACVLRQDACGNTPLHCAAQRNNAAAFLALWGYVEDKCAASRVQNANGDSVAHVAAQWGDVRILEPLLPFFDPKLQNNKQETVFRIAFEVYGDSGWPMIQALLPFTCSDDRNLLDGKTKPQNKRRKKCVKAPQTTPAPDAAEAQPAAQ